MERARGQPDVQVGLLTNTSDVNILTIMIHSTKSVWTFSDFFVYFSQLFDANILTVHFCRMFDFFRLAGGSQRKRGRRRNLEGVKRQDRGLQKAQILSGILFSCFS